MKTDRQNELISRLFSAALLICPVAAGATALPANTDALKKPFKGYVFQVQESEGPSDPSSGTGENPEARGGAGGEENASRDSGPASPSDVSESFTSSVVSQLSIAAAACEAVGTAYRTDCLAKELQAIARQMPASGEYAAAREALGNAAKDLASLSRENRDNSLPRLRVTVQAEDQVIRRPVAAVRQETAAATNAKALAILERTETVLLRSAESGGKAALHYQRIAQALNSSKVLLRS